VTVHRAAAQGFERGAAVYERARPSYPPEAVDHVVSVLGLAPGRTLVDLGAGTGKFTRLLTPSGARIVAVEPVAAMRALLASTVPDVEAVDGTAEAIPLGDGEADAVVAAQAFHWFATEAALADIARVLRPGGGLALVWNVRDRASPLVRDTDAVLDRYRGDTPSHATGAWRAAFERTDGFTPLEERRFANPQRIDRQGFVDRFLSVSIIAALDDAEQQRAATDLGALVAGLDEPFEIPQHTVVYSCSTR
jgi:SAM-dependent methyltransferase